MSRDLQNLDANGDLTLLGELDGVAEKIGEHLSDASRVSPEHRGQLMIDPGGHLDSLGLCDLDQQFYGVLNDGSQVELDVLEGEFAALDLGEVENVIEHLE